MRAVALIAWALSGCLVVFCAALPLGVHAQLVLAIAALGLMAAIRVCNLRGPFRAIFLGLGTFLVLRYIVWRLTNTLPSVASPVDFAVGIILLAAELYCVVMMFLSLFTVATPIDRAPAPRLSDDEAPSVDVYVPSYNESVEIVAPTLAAAKRMTYPAGKLNVFLLDDGGTDAKVDGDDPRQVAQAVARRATMQALCADLGVTYLTREDNSHAKAGNLNNGLENSGGELVAVFDADHVPAQSFLTETIGYFRDDAKLFLVQTPHFFLNPDPIEKNIATQGSPAENEMFYGLVQKGLDRWNAAFFCGSAAVLRREALEEVGGFHGSSITEDAETALELHARGWNSLYVEKPLTAGLQPETFDAFIGQRSRWCRGMVQILLLKNPLFRSGLTLPQRLCYLSSTLFWLFPLSRMIFIIAPMMFIFFNLQFYVANGQEFIAYTTTYMLAALMIQSYVFRRVRWPWISDVYEYVQSVMLFRAVLSVFVSPRTPKFNVTDKGQSLAENRLSSLALPYFSIFGLVAASIGYLTYRYLHEPAVRDLISVVGAWSVLNLVLAGVGLGAVAERRERRAVPRVAAQDVQAVLKIGADAMPVTIEEMSFGGLRVQARTPFKLPSNAMATLCVTAPEGKTFETVVVSAGRRTSEGSRAFGLRFFGTASDRFRIISHVAFADQSPLRSQRTGSTVRLGLVFGTAVLIGLWGAQVVRGLAYLGLRRGVGAAPAAARKPEEFAA